MAVSLIRFGACPTALVPQIVVLAFESGPVLFFKVRKPFN